MAIMRVFRGFEQINLQFNVFIDAPVRIKRIHFTYNRMYICLHIVYCILCAQYDVKLEISKDWNCAVLCSSKYNQHLSRIRITELCC